MCILIATIYFVIFQCSIGIALQDCQCSRVVFYASRSKFHGWPSVKRNVLPYQIMPSEEFQSACWGFAWKLGAHVMGNLKFPYFFIKLYSQHRNCGAFTGQLWCGETKWFGGRRQVNIACRWNSLQHCWRKAMKPEIKTSSCWELTILFKFQKTEELLESESCEKKCHMLKQERLGHIMSPSKIPWPLTQSCWISPSEQIFLETLP